jgi:antitoxin FitA
VEVSMSEVTITLPEERWQKLSETARRLGLSPEELARAGVEALLAEPDETFEQTIGYVLEKNAELYRRLA